MTEKRMTKKDYFNELKTFVTDNEELTAFIDHELELLSRKSSKSSQTKTQVENNGIKDKILIALENIGRPITVTELQKNTEDLKEFSNQKLSALLNQLVANNIVEKTTDKKKSYFAIA